MQHETHGIASFGKPVWLVQTDVFPVWPEG